MSYCVTLWNNVSKVISLVLTKSTFYYILLPCCGKELLCLQIVLLLWKYLNSRSLCKNNEEMTSGALKNNKFYYIKKGFLLYLQPVSSEMIILPSQKQTLPTPRHNVCLKIMIWGENIHKSSDRTGLFSYYGEDF